MRSTKRASRYRRMISQYQPGSRCSIPTSRDGATERRGAGPDTHLHGVRELVGMYTEDAKSRFLTAVKDATVDRIANPARLHGRATTAA